jgi:hypothetical protein
MIRVDRLKLASRLALLRSFIPVFRVFLLSCWALALLAQQTDTSQVTGVVTDSSNAAISNAQVRATQTETQSIRTVRTRTDGSYTIPNLPVGPYELRVTADGFTTYIQRGIVLQVNVNPEINAVLQVGAATEHIDVTADAAMVEMHETAVAQVVDQQRIVELPLNGRQATQLILLSGASAAGPPAPNLAGAKTYPSAVVISVAGGQPNTVNYLLDGGDNNDTFSNVNLPFPFPDALQEFNVQTSALTARYGLHSGAVVSIVTKSGSNEVHGDLFEFLRNGDVNARNFFAPVHDALKRNQFGGTIGGPILRNKLFFFAGYQGTRVRTAPTTAISIVPTQAVLSGDFSTILSSACLAKPVTLKAPFVGNRISSALFNPQALNLLKQVPVSSNPCGTVQYGIPDNSGEDQVFGRVDFHQSDKNSFFGRYFLANYNNPTGDAAQNALISSQSGYLDRSQSFTLGDNYVFGPGTLLALHATATRLRVDRDPPPGLPSPSDLGVNMASPVGGWSSITISNYFAVGCGNCSPAYFNSTAIQTTGDIDLVRGAHQVSFGANLIHNNLNDLSNVNTNGVFTFNGQISGNALADFMIGNVSSFLQANPQGDNVRQNYFALYGQDSWKVAPHVNLSMGLRWEPFFPLYDIDGRGANFDMADFLAGVKSQTYVNGPAGAIFHGDPGFPKANSNGKLDDFAPRLGLVIDRKGDGKEVIRASWGVFYDLAELEYDDRVNFDPPFGNSVSLSSPAGGFTNPWQGYPGGNAFPQGFPPPKNIAFPVAGVWDSLPMNLKPTYVQQWNVSWQRQVTANWLATVSYVGNHTTHLWLATELDPAVYIPGSSTTSNTNQRRVLYLKNPAQGQYYSTVDQTDDGGVAHYDGLMVSLQHRFSHDFSVLSNYTYSHCISDGEFANNVSGPVYEIQNDRAADRANCAYDHRQAMNTSVVGTSPAFGSRMVRRIAGGWQLSAIFTAGTGGFWNVTSGLDNSLTGVSLDRPNVVGPLYPSSRSFASWFKPSAFQANALGTFGNAGRNLIVGPDQIDLDMSLVRAFHMPFREAHKLEVRAEAFNIMNHANMNTSTAGSLHTSLTDPLLGTITAAADPRILQFALKYIF